MRQERVRIIKLKLPDDTMQHCFTNTHCVASVTENLRAPVADFIATGFDTMTTAFRQHILATADSLRTLSIRERNAVLYDVLNRLLAYHPGVIHGNRPEPKHAARDLVWEYAQTRRLSSHFRRTHHHLLNIYHDDLYDVLFRVYLQEIDSYRAINYADATQPLRMIAYCGTIKNHAAVTGRLPTDVTLHTINTYDDVPHGDSIPPGGTAILLLNAAVLYNEDTAMADILDCAVLVVAGSIERLLAHKAMLPNHNLDVQLLMPTDDIDDLLSTIQPIDDPFYVAVSRIMPNDDTLFIAQVCDQFEWAVSKISSMLIPGVGD